MENETETVVKLDADVARTMQGEGSPAESNESLLELRDTLRDLDIAISPMHPGAKDPELQTFFLVSRISSQEPERLVVALRKLHAVTAAYVKKPAMPPM